MSIKHTHTLTQDKGVFTKEINCKITDIGDTKSFPPETGGKTEHFVVISNQHHTGRPDAIIHGKGTDSVIRISNEKVYILLFIHKVVSIYTCVLVYFMPVATYLYTAK